MAIVDASVQDLRSAILGIRARYFALDEPRRWYTALVCAVLVKSGELPEWVDWQVEPPTGARIEMTPSSVKVIDELFGTPAEAVFRSVSNGFMPAMQNPTHVVLDPLRMPGRTTNEEALCLVLGNKRVDVALTDSSWLWNPVDGHIPPDGYGTSPEYKSSNDYGQQQGIYCAYPADQLFDLGPEEAARVMDEARPSCQYHAVANKPRRRKATDEGEPPSELTPICTLNQRQCAAKQAASGGPGGPRALIPSTQGGKEKLLAPGSFERILQDANPAGEPLPSIANFALVLDYLNKGGGKALDSNRVHALIAPEHTSLLFDP